MSCSSLDLTHSVPSLFAKWLNFYNAALSLSYYWHISFIVMGIVYIYITDYIQFILNIIVAKNGWSVSSILEIL